MVIKHEVKPKFCITEDRIQYRAYEPYKVSPESRNIQILRKMNPQTAEIVDLCCLGGDGLLEMDKVEGVPHVTRITSLYSTLPPTNSMWWNLAEVQSAEKPSC